MYGFNKFFRCSINVQVILGIFFISNLVSCGSSQVKDSTPGVDLQTDLEVKDITPGFSEYFILVPNAEHLSFYGEITDADLSAQGGPILYPGADIFSALVALAAHAAIADSANNVRKNKAREEADKVLVPYQDSISSMTSAEIITSSIDEYQSDNYTLKLFDENREDNVWRVDINPSYVMSSSEDSISIVNEVVISESKDSLEFKDDKERYFRSIYVQYYPSGGQQHWLENQANNFKAVIQSLMVGSISLAILDFNGKYDPVAEVTTIRYLSNGSKKVERGRVLAEYCQYVLFESLRGELKLLPAYTSKEDCVLNDIL